MRAHDAREKPRRVKGEKSRDRCPPCRPMRALPARREADNSFMFPPDDAKLAASAINPHARDARARALIVRLTSRPTLNEAKIKSNSTLRLSSCAGNRRAIGKGPAAVRHAGHVLSRSRVFFALRNGPSPAARGTLAVPDAHPIEAGDPNAVRRLSIDRGPNARGVVFPSSITHAARCLLARRGGNKPRPGRINIKPHEREERGRNKRRASRGASIGRPNEAITFEDDDEGQAARAEAPPRARRARLRRGGGGRGRRRRRRRGRRRRRRHEERDERRRRGRRARARLARDPPR